MGVVNTQYTFAANDVITSTKMNDIIDQTTVTGDAILGNTLEVAGGKLKIRSQGVTSNELATNAVTETKITNGSVTPEKLSSGGVTWGSGYTDIGPFTSGVYYTSLTPHRLSDGDTGLFFGAETSVSTSASIYRYGGINGDLNITQTGAGVIRVQASSEIILPAIVSGITNITATNFLGTATKASTLAVGGADGDPMIFSYIGQAGQPTWVWGSNDIGSVSNNYVWDPANFNVNHATTSGSADYATRAGNGPENGTFYQSNTANVNKIFVGGFGVNKGSGIMCQKPLNEVAKAVIFIRETGAEVGSIVIDNNNSTNFNTLSDYRLKEDFTPVSDGLLKVNALKPTNFKWVNMDARIDGFIAHEVKEVVSNAVTGEKDVVDENNDPVYQQMDASKLIPIMVAAIQELSKKVTELESK